jgi:hypothetical protein
MEVTPKSGIIRTADEFGDFQLHLEWATPSKVEGEGQGRGNNGVNIFGLYEVQILDSYDNVTYADGQAGALYGQFPPLVNAAKPPGEWQTYDILFEAPRWDKEASCSAKRRSPSSTTVWSCTTAPNSSAAPAIAALAITTSRTRARARSNSTSTATRSLPQHLDSAAWRIRQREVV